ncbi:MAG: 50S ribosomal protein L32 [Patescibacteria group bacterium]|nr:50S ribosomal protein L32 [Patescibacteria group bacterium]
MAVPKKKTPKAKTKSRKSANTKLSLKTLGICPKCKEPVLPHKACTVCGYYKGREILKVK